MTTRELELERQNKELLMMQRQLAHSKTRYADMFDFAPIGYCTLDGEGAIQDLNLAGARLLSGTPMQFLGRKLEEFVLERERTRFREHIRKCRTSGHRLRIELHLQSPDGEPIVLEVYSVATREMEHGALELRCAMVNVTERKRAEEALRRNEIELELRAKHYFLSEASAVFSASLNYDTVLDNIAHMSVPRLGDCCVIDMVQPDGTLLRSAVGHLDHDKEDLLWELGKLPHERNEIFGKMKVLRTGRSELYADVPDSLLRAVSRDGEHLRMLRSLGSQSMMCVPLIVRGTPIGTIGMMSIQPDRRYTLFDLALAEEFADRAAMAIDNAMLYSKEQAANQLKDEFMSIVSHELKTPLTPILGATYRLQQIRPNDADVTAMANIIERSAKRQARIVDDLLDVSRVTTGKFKLRPRLADLDALIHAAVEIARPAAEANGVIFDVSIASIPKQLWCDPERIQQALWNLLANAIKYSHSGGHVRLNAEARDAGVRVTVSDDGEGIRQDFLPHVFEPFRQGDQFTTRSHGGLGLGLSIVQHIIKHHGGVVRAESAGPGRGATFAIDLPYSIPSTAAETAA